VRDQQVELIGQLQRFNRDSASLLSALSFRVVIAILLTAIFDFTEPTVSPNADISLLDERLSPAFRSFSCSSMSRATHRDVFGRDIPRRNAT